MKWGDEKRDFDTILAVWPNYHPLRDLWCMHELVDRGWQSPAWRERRIPNEDGLVTADDYRDRKTAFAAAETLNTTLQRALMERLGEPTAKRSLELKVSKALQARQRLQEEEALMLSEARRRHESDPRPEAASLILAAASEQYRDELAAQLFEYPYLRMARVGIKGGRWSSQILFKAHDGSWSKPYMAGDRSANTAERAKIANGFGFDASTHWGVTKSRIREILLPRANQLLKLASVQRLLDEALQRGERVLISNGVVFWYEEDRGIGWQVKATATTRESEGATLWKEGTIRSTNHGRLVILPYIKEDGEHVRGHTKNGPNDGPSEPRHPAHYVEIPFSYLHGDLMIGLYGELPYE